MAQNYASQWVYMFSTFWVRSTGNIGVYRDGGLACSGYTSGPQADRIRQDFIKIFKEDFDLSITSETNLKAVNFLDVTLNPTTGKYQP